MTREEKIKLYDNLVATLPEAVRKGDTMPYTSVNGNMTSYFTKDNFWALRLSPTDREEFLKKYNTTLVYQYGIIQKEYVTVPESLLANTDELKDWFAIGYKYTSGLKPKPTNKAK